MALAELLASNWNSLIQLAAQPIRKLLAVVWQPRCELQVDSGALDLELGLQAEVELDLRDRVELDVGDLALVRAGAELEHPAVGDLLASNVRTRSVAIIFGAQI